MKSHNIVIYLIIPLALFSTLSLFDNVEAQTNSTTANNQTTSQQPQNQNTNLTAQALMKTNIVEIKDTLDKAKLEIIQGNLKEALQDVRDVETQLLLIKPSPTKLLSDLHKVTNAISKSEIDKSLNILTKVQVDILKAENEIFKAAVVNPQLIQHINNNEKDSDEEEDSKDVEEEDSKDVKKQFNTMEPIIDEGGYYTYKGDTFAGSVKQ